MIAAAPSAVAGFLRVVEVEGTGMLETDFEGMLVNIADIVRLSQSSRSMDKCYIRIRGETQSREIYGRLTILSARLDLACREGGVH